MISQLQRRIEQRSFAITAEVVAEGSGDLLWEATLLGDRVDAINVTGPPMAAKPTKAFTAAAMLVANGYQPVLGVSCSERTTLALAGDFLAAAGIGVRNILLLRDDDRLANDEVISHAGFGCVAEDQITAAKKMCSTGSLPSGRKIEPAPSFLVGVKDAPSASKNGHDFAGLVRKIESGVDFIQTRLCFDLDNIEAYVRGLRNEGVTERVGVIIGVGPVQSLAEAQWLDENVKHVGLQPETLARLGNARAQSSEGRKICAELIESLSRVPGVAGVHVVALSGGVEAIAATLELLPRDLRK